MFLIYLFVFLSLFFYLFFYLLLWLYFFLQLDCCTAWYQHHLHQFLPVVSRHAAGQIAE